MLEEIPDTGTLVPARPRYAVTSAAELAECEQAMQRLMTHVDFVVFAEDRDPDETEWDRHERGEDEEPSTPEEMPCNIARHSCECHGTTFNIVLFDQRVALRFRGPLGKKVILDCVGIRFHLGNIAYAVRYADDY